MTADLPPWAFAAALAGLPFMGWERLTALLAEAEGDPGAAWQRVVAGRAGAAWAKAAASVSPEGVATAHSAAGVAVHLHGDDSYPEGLAGDHEAPPVLFTRGSLSALDEGIPRVAMIGTRRCSGYGRDVAREFGRELAAAGVCVVSGLAIGIDGASHEGALAAAPAGARPVAVVGSGLDVVYPRRHASLWRAVAESGLIVSEAPLGARPEQWRFPARNRIIAALSHVLVVVESHPAGGSQHTVRSAEQRGVPVMAVPGPIRSHASAGTNRLLSEGCAPACDVDDVLVALALETAGAPAGSRRLDLRPPPEAADAAVLAALGWEAVSLEEVLVRTGLAPGRVAVALAHLEQDGWARGTAGWWERVGAQ
ncbi:MAG TPA: DNA-processing protein DprA [Acidimicrobiales bacterium]|nr:DNA-processing protein DprA [Acidimicrobiales bacterium]